MPAGQIYNKDLNRTNSGKTPYVYDTALDEWVAYTKQVGSAIGAAITGTSSTLAVTTASQVALAANANRKYAKFQNDSDTTIYLMTGAAAALNQGERLNPNGGSYEMSPAIGNLELTAVYAIHGGTGNKNLLIKEGI